ncbi:TetR/AcrR family transcriptional regulator [Candidatus Dependentiae bacterium]|nr:TetR/AcrR family transcriptional regulator [Candidatus Dependentiae bacterium]
MGIKERRLRERESLKKEIIVAAQSIASTEGWHAVTVRKIAQQIEYTPPIIYEFFKDKDALFLEIKREGLRKLLVTYQNSLSSSKDATELLTNFGAAYWEFAIDNPELYKIIYGFGGGAGGTTELTEEVGQIRLLIKDTLARVLQETKSPSNFDWEGAIDILRSLLHGMIAFSMSGAMRGDQERARSLAMKGIQDLVTFWMMDRDEVC